MALSEARATIEELRKIIKELTAAESEPIT
jgi:hypothetical protein